MISVILLDFPLRNNFTRFTRLTLPDFLQYSPNQSSTFSEFDLKKRWWAFSYDVKKRTTKPRLKRKLDSTTSSEKTTDVSWLDSFDGKKKFLLETK
jgi:hypothetical protein